MTDKEQIIIDGVDVSRCVFYQIEANKLHPKAQYCGSMRNIFCEDEPNCYFKQLARKTQECKKLNNKIIDMNSIIEDAAINLGNKDFTLYDLPFEIKKLSQECEELKERLDRTEEDLKYQCVDCMNVKSDRYRKALEGIEKVINNILNSCLGRNTVSCRPAHNVCGDLINILDIINKAKEDK